MKKMIYNSNNPCGCYFRSTVISPNLKVLLQITERCNMFCKHCFNSSNNFGKNLDFNDIKNKIFPKLKEANVTRITLTGGEPMTHPKIYEIITLFNKNNIHVTLCTNGLLFDEEKIKFLSKLGNIHINVSLDGFSYQSHGLFRGLAESKLYDKIINNIKLMGKHNILNSILCSPNVFSNDSEYIQMCHFAKDNGASYVLFNPLSKFGRGSISQEISYTKDQLTKLRVKLESLNIETNKFQIVFIRINKYTLSKECEVDCNCEIPYVFIDGSVGVCPYLIFATSSKDSKYIPEKFLYGNIFDNDFKLKEKIKNYNFLSSQSCRHRGCNAIKITNGLEIDDYDPEIYDLKGINS